MTTHTIIDFVSNAVRDAACGDYRHAVSLLERVETDCQPIQEIVSAMRDALQCHADCHETIDGALSTEDEKHLQEFYSRFSN